MNKFKEKIIRHKEALEMVLAQGNAIEKKAMAKIPTGKKFIISTLGKKTII